jgi:RNA polymerase sigma-70 factor (ECF subfamily)
VEPIADRLVVDDGGDPAAVVVARHRVRLALVASLQLLSPRQRAALLLADVLELPAAEIASLLATTVPAVKSLLQRGRARLSEAGVVEDAIEDPADDQARLALDAYIAAFEHSDMDALERLLADSVAIEMTGTTTWFSGKATCVPYLAAQAIGRPGEWRMRPLHVNGQLGAAAYRRNAAGSYEPFAVVVLAITPDARLARISLFADVTLFGQFELVLPSPTA